MPDILYNYSKQKTLLFAFFLLLYEFSTYISNDMIMPGMLEVAHSFNASDYYVSASLTVFILGGATLQLILGPLSDRYGRRHVMLFGVFLFFISNIVIVFSRTIHEFIIARFFQGMGLCFIGVVGYATIQEIFSEKYAVRLVSIMGNITLLAPLVGPLLGSLIMELFSWRAIFHVISFSALISLIGLWRFMPETVAQTKIDGSYNAPTPLKLSVLLRNYGILLTNKKFIAGACGLAFSFIPLIAWIGTSPLILIKAANIRILYYGLLQIPIFLTCMIGTIVMRHHLENQTLKQLVTWGGIIMLFSMALMMIGLIFNRHYLLLIVGLSAYSFGLGFTTGPLNRMVLFFTDVPKGTTSALASIITMFIMSAGTQFAGWIYSPNFNNFVFGLLCFICTVIFALLARVIVSD